MNQWYLIKCKYTREFTDGSLKRVTEPYLVSAMSFTEAEESIYRNVGELIRGEFQVTAIAIKDYQDIFFYDDSEVWYEASVNYVTEDADTGQEKVVKHNFLVTAHNVKEAYERIEDSLKGMMGSYETPKITKTAIVEIFLYDSEAAKDYAEKKEEEPSNVNVAFALNEEE